MKITTKKSKTNENEREVFIDGQYHCKLVKSVSRTHDTMGGKISCGMIVRTVYRINGQGYRYSTIKSALNDIEFSFRKKS